MKILVSGDFCENGRLKKEIQKENYKNIWGNVPEEIYKHDFRFVNFEFPIVTEKALPIEKHGPVLGGTTNSIDAIKYAGFNVCTLANNHILDQGPRCCIDTKRLLEENDIYTVGVGNDLINAEEVLYLTKNDETLAVINCCEHEFSIANEYTPGANPLNPIHQYNRIKEARVYADYVLVIVHGGIEHYQFPTKRMIELYRFFIDAGADLVINHHQHCYSGSELYKGKYIYYGLGNLLFDWTGKRNSMWNEGFMVSINLAKDKIETNEIPYFQCNDDPSVRLMDDSQKTLFFKEYRKISNIIQDKNLLNNEFEKMIKSESSMYELILQPYDNRILKGLYRRGLLPSFVTQQKKLGLINYLECESHFERIMYTIKSLLK